MEAKDRIIVALDVPNLTKAMELTEALRGEVGLFKVGLELFSSEGPDVLEQIGYEGDRIFLDLKLFDIPNTVASTAQVLVRYCVEMFNLHCLGGSKMMEETVKAVRAESDQLGTEQQPKILGVTILTSTDQGMLENEMKISVPLTEMVIRLARLADLSGLDGVIASPKEITAIRQHCRKDFLIVTPGVRPEWAATNDQKRVMTPGEAVKAGADYLVIGRPITKPPSQIGSPIDAARLIATEIAEAERK